MPGWVGQITSNSFMKREFGSKLIEDFLVHQDLRLIADTSGAYIPGHGTPHRHSSLAATSALSATIVRDGARGTR